MPENPLQPDEEKTTATTKKKKRNLPGNPDPDAEVVVLSPKTLMTTNRFICEICGKGFQRDQNLQLHRRGHNLPWKLKQKSSRDRRKKAYVCPEPTCPHHHPSRALGDLTGIKKHYCRKHGEKKWKCDKCTKIYAVQSDWKAHSKTCGTREYRCDCGTLFSRKDRFMSHRAFCDALAEESAKLYATTSSILAVHHHHHHHHPHDDFPIPNGFCYGGIPSEQYLRIPGMSSDEMMASAAAVGPIGGSEVDGFLTRDFLGLAGRIRRSNHYNYEELEEWGGNSNTSFF
ncbi:hypothetical protein M569_09280 [Genlisea aurea]|uniref:C2H2-type domain-containing protein n=1 Tax=Genlisea aurea TaxID=192259 RepID=S8DZN6_9LAMI|nr:hypothetical protein M569_09280 [Genlisea aurea]